MLRRPLFAASIILLALPLTGFRMPASGEVRDKMLYDVRGAFVTARPDIPRTLVTATDDMVDAAIQKTTRSMMLPRAILAVKIDRMTTASTFLGNRHLAHVTVQAVSVSSGDPIAEGSFIASVFLFDTKDADRELARKISERIMTEFRLDGTARRTLVSAFAN